MAEARATTIRFAEKVYGRLERVSEETGLPINSVVVMAVLEWLEAHPPELVGRGARPFEMAASIPLLQPRFGRRIERRLLPWPASPRAFDQFSRSAQNALVAAQRSAEAQGAEYIGTAHLLAALTEHGLARRILGRLELAAHEIEALAGQLDPVPAAQPAALLLPSSRVKAVLRLALEEADRDRLHYVGTEHLLLGIVLEGESGAARLLAEKGATEQGIRDEIASLRDTEEA